MELQTIPIKSLRPFARNPRTHPDSAIAKLVKSIETYGWTNPVLVNKDMTVLAGHARLKAAQKLGMKDVPVIVLDIPDEYAAAYVIADNRIQDETSWDLPTLKDILQELDTGAFDMEATGFDEHELEQMMTAEHQGGNTDDDAVPDEAPAICQPGDLWLLGEHRLLCGDSTKAEDVARLMDGQKADAVVTDPPYGVGVKYNSCEDTEASLRGLIERFMPIVLKCPAVAITSGVMNMWLYPRPAWVGSWVHPAAMAPGPWGFNGNNPILYYGHDPYLKAGKGSHPDSLVMAAGREGVEGHPTPKPVKVWEWLVERMTIAAGRLVFDPFLGSGTTLIACEKLGRKCYGMEIDPHYCDVIVKRWEDYTGKKATKACTALNRYRPQYESSPETPDADR